jgi:hypothetical protein
VGANSGPYCGNIQRFVTELTVHRRIRLVQQFAAFINMGGIRNNSRRASRRVIRGQVNRAGRRSTDTLAGSMSADRIQQRGEYR